MKMTVIVPRVHALRFYHQQCLRSQVILPPSFPTMPTTATNASPSCKGSEECKDKIVKAKPRTSQRCLKKLQMYPSMQGGNAAGVLRLTS